MAVTGAYNQSEYVVQSYTDAREGVKLYTQKLAEGKIKYQEEKTGYFGVTETVMGHWVDEHLELAVATVIVAFTPVLASAAISAGIDLVKSPIVKLKNAKLYRSICKPAKTKLKEEQKKLQQATEVMKSLIESNLRKGGEIKVMNVVSHSVPVEDYPWDSEYVYQGARVQFVGTSFEPKEFLQLMEECTNKSWAYNKKLAIKEFVLNAEAACLNNSGENPMQDQVYNIKTTNYEYDSGMIHD